MIYLTSLALVVALARDVMGTLYMNQPQRECQTGSEKNSLACTLHTVLLWMHKFEPAYLKVSECELPLPAPHLADTLHVRYLLFPREAAVSIQHPVLPEALAIFNAEASERWFAPS